MKPSLAVVRDRVRALHWWLPEPCSPPDENLDRLCGYVELYWDLTDEFFTPLDVSITWSFDARSWRPCTAAPGEHDLRDLASSPDGTRHSWYWDSLEDLGPVRVVVFIRIAVTHRNFVIIRRLIDNTQLEC